MTTNYELAFSVGSLTGRLISMMPFLTPSDSENIYYEHNHSGIELHYIANGTCTFICGKKLINLNAGDILLIPPGKYHRGISDSEDIDKMNMQIEFSPSKKDLSEGDKSFYEAFSIEEPAIISPKSTAIRDILCNIRELAADDTCGYATREKLRAYSALLTVELYSEISASEKILDNQRMRPEFSEKYIIDTFMAVKFMSNSANKDLAKKLHISQRQLSRTLTKIYGMNYREKLKEIRVEIATNFLTTTDKSIGEIAEILGYSTAAAFNKFLKSATGKTPSAIRKEARKR